MRIIKCIESIDRSDSNSGRDKSIENLLDLMDFLSNKTDIEGDAKFDMLVAFVKTFIASIKTW